MQKAERFELPREEEKRRINHVSLLRSKDVAHLLDVSPDDVVDLVHKGKLRAIKVGRIWRYRVADVQAYKRRNSAKRKAVG